MLRNSRNYSSAIEALNQLQTRTQTNTLKNADKLRAMMKYLARCDITLEKLNELSVVHVTGTHGKGTTCLYTENILQNHGYKTGFYSSPHVLEVRERIRIGGKPISKNDFARHFWKVYDMLDSQKENECDMPLYFPFLTVLAFHVFLEDRVDVAIVEVGIGGEYDCTNVVRNTVAVGITPINVDHTAILGTCVESIAWHKGGIMKEDCLAFTVEQPDEALQVLVERGKQRKVSKFTIVGQFPLPADTNLKVPQRIKRTNAGLAIALSKAFMVKMSSKGKSTEKFSADVAVRAVEEAFWPGRYQIKQMKGIRFFLDGAHTLQSLRTCAGWFEDQTGDSDKKKVLIFNLTGKRDAAIFLSELLRCQFDVAIFIPNVGYEESAADTTDYKLTTDTQLTLCEVYRQIWVDLEKKHGKRSETYAFPSFARALRSLDDGTEYDALVTGSLYLVGAALSVLDPTLDGTLVD